MTSTSLYFVQSNAIEGRDDDFNDWYDSTHVPDILALDGFVSAQRFRRSAALDRPDAPAAKFTYVALYEIEGDPVAAVGALGAAVRDGTVGLSDSMAPGTTSTLFEALGEKRM
ncbi:MAG: hypothetical protein ABWY20_01820, partial [Mycobacterium sp.]